MKKCCLEQVADNTDKISQLQFSFKQSFLVCDHWHNSICSESSRKYRSLRNWWETVAHSIPMLRTRACVCHSPGLALHSAKGQDHSQDGSTFLKIRILVLAFFCSWHCLGRSAQSQVAAASTCSPDHKSFRWGLCFPWARNANPVRTSEQHVLRIQVKFHLNSLI